MGTLKNILNETVLLNTLHTCFDKWERIIRAFLGKSVEHVFRGTTQKFKIIERHHQRHNIQLLLKPQFGKGGGTLFSGRALTILSSNFLLKLDEIFYFFFVLFFVNSFTLYLSLLDDKII